MPIGSIMNTSTLSPTFDGEFNNFISSPDGSTGLWQTTLGYGNRTLGTNGEEEYYSDSSVGANPFSVQNGVLDITASPGSNPLNLPYNSGVITTESSFNQLYGYFEIDAKMPAGQGLWPAFWLLPASGAWPPELDVFEVLGNDPTTLYFSTHSTVQATQGTTLNVANVSSGFNLYGVMWGPQTVDLYINNVEVASMPTPADMNVPMYMLANLAVGGYWPGDPNSSTPFPATMQISYIKAFAYPGTTGGTVYDTLPSQNVGAAAIAPVITAPATLQAQTNVATSVAGVSVAANWPGGDFTVTVSDSKGLLLTTATADVFTSGEGTTSVTLIGNLSPIENALATLTYQGTTVGSEEVWISATDPQGQESLQSLVATDVATTVPPVSVPTAPVPPTSTPSGTTPPSTTPSTITPVLTTPAVFTLVAGTTEALSGLSAADSQMSSASTVVISDSSGLLRTQVTTGVTAIGEASTSLTLTGTLTAIDTALATLTYQAGAAAVGSDWLWISAAAGSGPQGLGHVVVTVTAPPVVAQPVPPVVTTPAALNVIAGVAKTLAGVSVSDSQSTAELTVLVSDSTGLLNSKATSGVTAAGENSTSLTLTGTSTAIDAELSSLTYASGTAGSDWLWVSANDATGQQALNHTVVTVAPAPVVVKPVVTAPANFSATAGEIGPLGGVSVTDSQTGILTVRVSDSTGLLQTKAFTGVTVQGENTTALTLTGSAAAIDGALPSLTYQAGTAAGTDWLWVSANDVAGNQGLSSVVVTVAAPPPNPTVKLTGVMLGLSNNAVFVKAVLTDTLGLLATSSGFGVTATGEGSTALTLQGLASSVNAELTTLTYTGNAHYPTAGATDSLSVGVWGSTGTLLTTQVMPLSDGHLSH
jgi:beta-glucanase (GH16 family)